MTVRKAMLKLLRDQRGATAIEYGLIAALIVLAMMTALQSFANNANAMFDEVSTKTGEAMD